MPTPLNQPLSDNALNAVFHRLFHSPSHTTDTHKKTLARGPRAR